MRRGEVRLVDFDPGRGSEAARRRPAIVVSNDGANSAAARLGRGVVTVVPMTSNVSRVYPFQVLVRTGESGLAVDSKAQAEQVRSVSVQRVGQLVGELPAAVLVRVDDALRLHLSV